MMEQQQSPTPHNRPANQNAQGTESSLLPDLNSVEFRRTLREISPDALPVPTTGQVRREQLVTGEVILRLGDPTEKVVTFTQQRMESLYEALREMKKDTPRSLIITGPHPGLFCFGADVHALNSITDAHTAQDLAAKGQLLFRDIARLECPKVAAIGGTCVGGAAEITLQCDHRIMSSAPHTMIGFPEILLGIFPAWTGNQILPRIVGIKHALKAILTGKFYKPEEALSIGLVDEIVTPDKLIERALQITRHSAGPSQSLLSLTEQVALLPAYAGGSIARKLGKVRKIALRDTKSQDPHGLFPAAPAIVDSVLYGLDHGINAGLARDAAEFGKLATSPISKNLQHVYFQREAAKALGKAHTPALSEMPTVIYGAGVMGTPIAGLFLKNGAPVHLVDTRPEALTAARQALEAQFKDKPDAREILARFTCGEPTDWSATKIVVEVIAEKTDAKRGLLQSVAAKVSPDTILASNTSACSIAKIAEGIPNPERVVGMHFFNPVKVVEITEVISTEITSEYTLNMVQGIVGKLGKLPLTVKNVPGFLLNRILTPYLNESLLLMRDGYAPADIDREAEKLGMKMGPLRTFDLVGLDIALHVGTTLAEAYGDRFSVSESTYVRGQLKRLIELGRYGDKLGGGFYLPRSDPKMKLVSDPVVEELFRGDTAPRPLDSIVSKRLSMALVNEAVRCLDDGVAGEPGQISAGKIDLGTVLGFGGLIPHGGAIRYAESIGAAALLEQLTELQSRCSAPEGEPNRFTPTEGIVRRAQSGQGFY